jgi:hypothetical protein
MLRFHQWHLHRVKGRPRPRVGTGQEKIRAQPVPSWASTQGHAPAKAAAAKLCRTGSGDSGISGEIGGGGGGKGQACLVAGLIGVYQSISYSRT